MCRLLDICRKIAACSVGVSLLLLIHIGCQDDIKSRLSNDKNNEVTFTTQAIELNDSRTYRREFLGMIENDSLFVTIKEEDTFDSRTTVGTSMVDFFNVTAFTNDGQLYVDNQHIQKVSDSWDYTPKLYWLKNHSLHFFSYTWNVGNNPIEPEWSIANSEYSALFNYSLPEPIGDSNDAEHQPDILFAFAPDRTKLGGTVELPFYHTLSAVRFNIGELSEDLVVSKAIVSLNDVCSAGTCSIKYSSTDNCICEWSYPAPISKGSYVETVLNINDKVLASDSENFMMIPQTLTGTDATLKVSLLIGQKLYEYEKRFEELSSEWESNNRYTYTFSITKESVEVSVEDDYSIDIKDNVRIQNVGYSTSYIRAAIVGYWSVINSDGVEEVVASWDVNDATAGTLVKPADWDIYWEESNGIYYHLEPVTPGNYTVVPLFTSYTLKKTTGPVNGSKLNIHIVTQAIDADGNIAKENWTDAPMWK